jgi:hypothetical protein
MNKYEWSLFALIGVVGLIILVDVVDRRNVERRGQGQEQVGFLRDAGRSEATSNHPTIQVSVVTVDSNEYVVVSAFNGVAVCPKTK